MKPFQPGAPLLRQAPPIPWGLVGSVVALQACLQLGWIVYGTYQPVLLQRFGFLPLVPVFVLLGGVLGLVVEPLSGALSDRHGDRARGRLLPITVAVTAAGLIFLTTAALLRQGSPWFSSALPWLMLFWVVAVQWASSPNLAQLNEAVPLASLPLAVALLTVSQGLIGAFSGDLARLALRMGPAASFLLGAVVLALGLAVLRSGQAAVSPGSRSGQGSGGRRRPAGLPGPADLIQAALLLGVALAVGGLSQILLDLLPRLARSAPAGTPLWSPGSLLLLCSAIGAPFTARVVGRWGRLPSLAAGVLLLAGVLAVSLRQTEGLGPPQLVLLGVLHSLVATSLTATSLAVLPPGWSGLGAGLALGGSGLAASLVRLSFGAAGPLGAPRLLGLLAASSGTALVGCLLLTGRSRRGVA